LEHGIQPDGQMPSDKILSLILWTLFLFWKIHWIVKRICENQGLLVVAMMPSTRSLAEATKSREVPVANILTF